MAISLQGSTNIHGESTPSSSMVVLLLVLVWLFPWKYNPLPYFLLCGRDSTIYRFLGDWYALGFIMIDYDTYSVLSRCAIRLQCV